MAKVHFAAHALHGLEELEADAGARKAAKLITQIPIRWGAYNGEKTAILKNIIQIQNIIENSVIFANIKQEY